MPSVKEISLIDKLRILPELTELIDLDDKGLVDNNKFTIRKAAELLDRKYRGDISKCGKPTIDHFFGVARLMPYPDEKKLSEEAYKKALVTHKYLIMRALFHDIREDKDKKDGSPKMTHHELMSLGLPKEVTESIERYTDKKFKHLGKNYYLDYFVEEIIHSPDDKDPIVKLADTNNNMSDSRFADLARETKTKLAEKYTRSRSKLKEKVFDILQHDEWYGWKLPDYVREVEAQVKKNFEDHGRFCP